MLRFSEKRSQALVCSWVATACILAAGSLAPAETFSFANGYDGWTPFTNDGNPANGWESRNGCLMQMAANDDAEMFGDRYLIRDNALNLGTEVGSYLETATDMMLVD